MPVYLWGIYSFLGLLALYVIVRIVSRAVFKSFFEVKTEHESTTNKEVKNAKV